MLADLILRNQRADYAPYSEAERIVLVALIQQGDQPISAQDLLEGIRKRQEPDADNQLPNITMPNPAEIEFFLKTETGKGHVTRSLKTLFGTPKFYFKL